MVIVLKRPRQQQQPLIPSLDNNNNNQYHQEATESLEPLQERSTKPQNDQISQDLQTSPKKSILVSQDLGEYLPILCNKIITHYKEKNLKRQKDGSIHIFEIINCLRQSLIFQQYPEEIDPITIWDCMNFDHGLLSETVLVDILESQKEDKDSSTAYQHNIDFSGISGHPDYIEGDWVFELKSINKFKPLILSDESVKGYIKQVVYYMILMDIEKGRIIVKYNLPFFPEKIMEIVEDEQFPEIKTPLYKLNFHKDTGQIPYYTVKITIDPNDELRSKVKMALLNILKPLYEQGDITQIPRLDGAVEGTNYKCNTYCKARKKCMEIPDLQTDFNVRHIILNKHIEEQMDRIRVYGKRQDKFVINAP